MNSLLLLLLLLALIVIFLFSFKKNEQFADHVSFYPADKIMMLEDCTNIQYLDCLLDNSENCVPESPDNELKTLLACNDKPIKIFTDMIYGNEYIFIEKPYTLNDIGEEVPFPNDEGVILVRFPKTIETVPNWFKVGKIDEFGYTLNKLYKELDSDNLPVKTQIQWKFNEPIVFIHRQKTERLPIEKSISLVQSDGSTKGLFCSLRDGNILFIEHETDDNTVAKESKIYDLEGELIDLSTKTDEQITSYYESSRLSTIQLGSINLIKLDPTADPLIIEITDQRPKLNKINSKTLYFNGDNGWKQTYNPSDYYIDKNMILLSKLYTNNNEIKNIEKDIDNLIEKINL